MRDLISLIENGPNEGPISPNLEPKITEGYHTTFKSENGDDVDVFENPSRNEFLKILHNSHERILRAWVWPNRVLVWDAFLSTHDVNFDLDPDGKHTGEYVNSILMTRDHVMINHYNQFGATKEEAMANAKEFLGSNPVLQRIYGKDVPFQILDWDEDLEGGSGAKDDDLLRSTVKQSEDPYVRDTNMLEDAATPKEDNAPYIDAHRSGDVIWIDMMAVPSEHRGKGIGRQHYEAWEASLPPDIKLIRLMAADTGEGVSNGFWEAMGFEYQYDGEDLDYETSQSMWKGVNGHETPPTVNVDDDEENS
jgi:GNAT superfamily N-acetyltransferase